MKSSPRFFIPPSAVNSQLGTIVYENSNLCKQLSRVLRLRAGDKLDFLDGLGTLYKCKLEHCEKDEVKALIVQTVKFHQTASVLVTMSLPILKGDRFDWALEKMTEIGANKIIPIVLERSVVKPDTSSSESSGSANRFTRWHSILREASEQCERATIPQLVMPLSFQSMLSEAAADQKALKIICAERSNSPHLLQLLCQHFKHQQTSPADTALCNQSTTEVKGEVIIAIGAEGGFTEKEVLAATELGFIPVSLGPLILRAETAAIYALAIATSCLDMKA